MAKRTAPRPTDVARWVADANMQRPSNMGGAALRENYTVPRERAQKMLDRWGLGLDGKPLATTCAAKEPTVASTVAIVLAWLDEDFRVVQARRADLGERPVLEAYPVAKAAMWLNDGTAEDVTKAKAFAAGANNERMRVYVYPTSEPDPLGRSWAASRFWFGTVDRLGMRRYSLFMTKTNRKTAEQINAEAAKRAKRSLARLAVVAAKYPGLAAYWAGSAGASVEADIANGRQVIADAR